MGTTTIEWTDERSNPFEILIDDDLAKGWFCTKVSPGCANCYSWTMNNWVGNRLKYSKGNEKRVTVRLKERELERISKLKKPKRIFMFDMTDLFHRMFSDDFVFVIFDFMREHPQHIFQILTKRAERMHDLVHIYVRDYCDGKPLPNVWLMVSAEDQVRADERIPWLLKTPALVHGVSCEPLLGKIDLGAYLCETYSRGGITLGKYLDWVVTGCESGRRRRPADANWFRLLRCQSNSTRTPFFLKQMDVDGEVVKMPELDGEVWDQFPVLG